jgi:hypothetical protein
MKILPPKKTKDPEGNEQNSWPDDAPETVVAVDFIDGQFVFYEPGDAMADRAVKN